MSRRCGRGARSACGTRAAARASRSGPSVRRCPRRRRGCPPGSGTPPRPTRSGRLPRTAPRRSGVGRSADIALDDDSGRPFVESHGISERPHGPDGPVDGFRCDTQVKVAVRASLPAQQRIDPPPAGDPGANTGGLEGVEDAEDLGASYPGGAHPSAAARPHLDVLEIGVPPRDGFLCERGPGSPIPWVRRRPPASSLTRT